MEGQLQGSLGASTEACALSQLQQASDTLLGRRVGAKERWVR